jgi:hypothetical protein
MAKQLALIDIASVAPQLSRLIPLLASNQDGEVVATARAIGRVLTGKGLDWHALSQAVSEIKRLSFQVSPPRTKPSPPREMAAWCRHHGSGRLSSSEREFIRSIAARLAQGGRPTTRQIGRLASIYIKLHDGRVA